MPGGRRIPITVDADTKGDFDKAADGLDQLAKSADDADGSLGKLTKGHEALDAEIDKTASSVKALRSEFEQTGDIGLLKDASKLDRTRQGLERLRAEFTAGTAGTVGLGDGIGKAEEKVKDLDARLREARVTVRDLAEEFTRTRDIDVFAKLNRAGKEVSELSRLKKAVEEFATDAERAGVKAGTGLMSGMTSAFQAMPPQAQVAIVTGIVGAIVVGAPVIGAATAAAVSLGVGGGVLAAGIAAAAQDARVQSSWGRLGEDVKKQLVDAGAVFAPGLVRAADSFGETFSRDVMPSVRADFASLVPTIDRLAAGAGGLVKAMMPGLDRLIVASGPILNELAAELPRLGAAMSGFFDSIARGAPGAKAFLSDFLHLTEMGIRLTGTLVEVLSKDYALFGAIARVMAGDVSGAMIMMEQFADRGGQATGAAGQVAAAALQAAGGQARIMAQGLEAAMRAAGGLKQVFDQLNGTQINLTQAQINAEAAVDNLSKALTESGGSLDLNTEKGRAAAQTGLDLARTASEVAQKTYDQTGSVDKAAAAFQVYRQQLIDSIATAGGTRQATDETRRAAGLLADQIMQMPALKKIDIQTPGLDASIEKVISLQRNLDGLRDRTIYTTVIQNTQTGQTRTSTQQSGLAYNRWGGAYEHAAVGTLREASMYSAANPGRYMIAEPQTRGEAFIPKVGDYGRSMSILDQAASWYDAAVVPRSSGYASPVTPARGGGGGTTTVVHEHRVVVQEPSGRRLAELVISDGRNGGPISTYIRQTATR